LNNSLPLSFNRFLRAAHCGSGSVLSHQEDNHQAEQRYKQLPLEYRVDGKNFQEKPKERKWQSCNAMKEIASLRSQ
jgi:hypothetical protein